MGAQLFANFIETTLAADITDVATSLTLTSDSGFPTISGGSGDWFMMVLVDSTNAPEIVKCTARTGTTCTITRAQEGTSARAWTLSPTTAIYLPTTKGALEQIQDDITAISDLIGGNDAGDILTTDDTQTLTNKTLTSPTLTSPVINTGVSGTAFIDDDTMATASSSNFCSGESVKAYVDNNLNKPEACFLVRLSGNDLNLPVGSYYTFLFNNESFDKGSDFDTSTYTFTAPVDGVYHFDVSVLLTPVDTASTQISIILTTSGGSYNFERYPSIELSADGKMMIAFSIDVRLSSGDSAYVRYYQTGGAQQVGVYPGSTSTWFSGHLVYKE